MWTPIKLNNNNYGIHNGYGLVLRKLSGYSTKREAQKQCDIHNEYESKHGTCKALKDIYIGL